MDCNGKILDLSRPVIMGILNLTPDSFFDGGKYMGASEVLQRANMMISDGAAIIDLGAVSTRPGSSAPSEQEEISRLLGPFRQIRKTYPDVVLSIDTYRAGVARIMIEEGADMINDISGGTFDLAMMPLIAKAGIPYIIMHIKGTPENMQVNPHYSDVFTEVRDFLATQAGLLKQQNNEKIILDPGFGFGKNPDHNFELLKRLGDIKSLGHPVMAGISRKSMINRILEISPENALNGTTVLNTIALMKGADILRVHDVREAVEAVKLVEFYNNIEL